MSKFHIFIFILILLKERFQKSFKNVVYKLIIKTFLIFVYNRQDILLNRNDI